MKLGERIFIQTLAFALVGLIAGFLLVRPTASWISSGLAVPVCDFGAGEYLFFYFLAGTTALFGCAPIFASIDGQSTGQLKAALRYLLLSCAVYGSVLVYYRIAYLRLLELGSSAGIMWIDVLTDKAPTLSIALAYFTASLGQMIRSIRKRLRIGATWPIGS